MAAVARAGAPRAREARGARAPSRPRPRETREWARRSRAPAASPRETPRAPPGLSSSSRTARHRASYFRGKRADEPRRCCSARRRGTGRGDPVTGAPPRSSRGSLVGIANALGARVEGARCQRVSEVIVDKRRPRAPKRRPPDSSSARSPTRTRAHGPQAAARALHDFRGGRHRAPAELDGPIERGSIGEQSIRRAGRGSDDIVLPLDR